MTYNQNFVAVVKSSGKILREVEPGLVQLPFKSEYSILLKNLNSRRALVAITVDGKSIGSSLIIEPNSDIELERFLESNISGNRFRFIQKTKEIVDYRGDRVDDGIIRIEVKYEKIVEHHTIEYHHVDHWHNYNPPYYTYPVYTPPYVPYQSPSWTFYNSSTPVLQGNISSYNCSVESKGGGNCTTISNSGLGNITLTSYVGAPLQDEGITVKGSHSNQAFVYGQIGTLEENSIVIILRLRGYVGKDKVQKPFTVKTKLTCPTCGKHNKSYNTCCSRCGTALM